MLYYTLTNTNKQHTFLEDEFLDFIKGHCEATGKCKLALREQSSGTLTLTSASQQENEAADVERIPLYVDVSLLVKLSTSEALPLLF